MGERAGMNQEGIKHTQATGRATLEFPDMVEVIKGMQILSGNQFHLTVLPCLYSRDMLKKR